MPAPNGAIPVESILKLTLDKAGSQTIQDFLDKQEKSWGSVEQYVGRISSHIENMGRFGLGLAGVAGVGAVVQNFMATSQAGSNVALAAGHVAGGAGVWHPYGQAMLGAQARTGVGASDIAQGLIMAVQSVGGSPSPQQAAVLGGLIAGYGQTVGMSPSQVAQVISPILQAAGKPLNMSSILGAASALSGTLTAFPGSQAAPMLGVVSNLALSQALGSGPAHGFATNPHGVAALVNAAAMTNSVFRNPGVAGAATSAISGGIQNAYGNPSMEAFLQRAGLSYWQQRQGLTPANAQAIMREATSMYGTGVTRDLALRSMFGLQGADMLEALSTPHGQANLHQSLAHHASSGGLLNQIHHAQQRSTPSGTANRFGAGILHWLEASPLHALLGGAGALFGPGLIRSAAGKGAGAAARGLGRLLHGAGSEGAAAEEGGALSDALGFLGPLLGVGGIGYALAASGAGNPLAFHKGELPVGAGYGRAGGLGGNALPPWMQHHATARAAHITGGRDPVEVFAQASKDLELAAQMFARGPWSKLTSYSPSAAAQPVSLLGTPGIQAIGAGAPGMEFAALSLGSAFSSGASQPASYTAPAPSPGSGQPCTLTWYDPALGGINGGGTYADGGQYQASDMACAAPPQYPFGTQIRFSYGGRSITCTVRDRGGAITGSHFDLTRGAFNALASTSHGVLHATFSVVSTGNGVKATKGQGRSFAPSRNIASPGRGGGGGGGGGQPSTPGSHPVYAAHDTPVHVHVHVDGREQHRHRVLLGHR